MTTTVAARKLAYARCNEGLGGCYERIAFTRNMMRIAQARSCTRFLEFDASYIAGIPGFNSCVLAMEGYDVTVTINPRDYEDARHAWEMLGLLGPNVHLLMDDGTLHLPSKSFDFVWNHLAFEHYEDPADLIREMGRLSTDVVFNLTLAPYNFGFLMHRFNHWTGRKPWDHGRMSQTTIGAMRKAHHRVSLQFIEAGAADVPPWMDTVDATMKGSMTYLDTYPAAIRDRWIWCSADPAAQQKPIVKAMWAMEQAMPTWFKCAVGHHLFVASSVKK